MKNEQKGFIVPAMIAIVLILTISGYGYLYLKSKKNSKVEEIITTSTFTNNLENNLEIKNNITQENSTTTKKNENADEINVPEIDIDLRFDNFFKEWVTAWNKRDANVLMNTFGYADFQVQNMEDDDIWHYTSYQLYKSKTIPNSDLVGYYYIVSKTNDIYHIAIIHGNYWRISQWQVWSSVYNPQVFSSIQDAKNKIDELVGI